MPEPGFAESWALGGCAGLCCRILGWLGMSPGSPSEDEALLSVRWVLIFHPYQEDSSIHPEIGKIQSECCALPSSGFKWKIQFLALLALLK